MPEPPNALWLQHFSHLSDFGRRARELRRVKGTTFDAIVATLRTEMEAWTVGEVPNLSADAREEIEAAGPFDFGALASWFVRDSFA